MATATADAPVDPGPAPGAIPALPVRFDLSEIGLTNGKTVARLALPAFNIGGDAVGVSLSSPPGVLLVSGGLVLVNAELDETGVVEAIRAPG